MKYILISFFILVIGLTGIFNPVKNVFNRFASPVEFGLRNASVGIKEFFSFYANLRDVRRENIKMLEDKVGLESQIAELKIYEEENKILRQQLNLEDGDSSDISQVMADVMGNPSDATLSTVYINKGDRDGVRVGDNVILGRYLVGIVKEVSVNRALVELLTSPNVTVAVYNIDSDTKTEGLAVGRHGSSVTVEKILPEENLDLGDMFITSGRDGKYMPGYYLGKVININETASQPLKSADVSTIINISSLDKIFVLMVR